MSEEFGSLQHRRIRDCSRGKRADAAHRHTTASVCPWMQKCIYQVPHRTVPRAIYAEGLSVVQQRPSAPQSLHIPLPSPPPAPLSSLVIAPARFRYRSNSSAHRDLSQTGNMDRHGLVSYTRRTMLQEERLSPRPSRTRQYGGVGAL
jgi:hypothetical protein